MCGVAAGACGGAIDLYWATGNGDISEVNAKFSAQVGRKSGTVACLTHLDSYSSYIITYSAAPYLTNSEPLQVDWDYSLVQFLLDTLRRFLNLQCGVFTFCLLSFTFTQTLGV